MKKSSVKQHPAACLLSAFHEAMFRTLGAEAEKCLVNPQRVCNRLEMRRPVIAEIDGRYRYRSNPFMALQRKQKHNQFRLVAPSFDVQQNFLQKTFFESTKA